MTAITNKIADKRMKPKEVSGNDLKRSSQKLENDIVGPLLIEALCWTGVTGRCRSC
jgi:hypothetical protein